ncbi:UDP-N-acetylmuramoyl-tripeptide--D-alanyl-D-alanine ligase [Aquisalimonas sp. 2447]|uniref:UDP-N-acetylmuramoyl-tripeptide--D-alanyl-D- alanine ligase n=1 Tax=Aquisalimonas sp. 2447 TaxID=2740807 RepID=UPI0014327F74|nr:UDP-N-acetylmuramoyl-tripeptide--D-alanyl-D-alanine ligase [Aquisalimonas sp. 2447]QIT56282.1 UDP-N-acetylmuramoyl-tripeptide--D-alanyl-D-alanine ligase [Aquisalimonas sp. 2447]
MIHCRLDELAAPLGARLSGPSVAFRGVSTDSRSVNPGELFVALEGERFDGHGFLSDAVARGAAAVMVRHGDNIGAPALVVEDTRRALGALARHWRRRCTARIAAITGSNGKTTVKEMLGAILNQVAPTLVTRGNLNNDIGVPLTLFRLAEGDHFAVVEMGANHGGEIATLAAIAEPDVGVVTNAGPSHLEGFGSVDGVARGKGEMFQGLGAGGTAVINADDAYADLWRQLAGGKAIVDFGIDAPAAVSASPASPGQPVRISLPAGTVSVRLPVPGRHNLMNALAAAAAASALGASPEAIRSGLEGVSPVAGRLNRRNGVAGSTVLDDTYNANPASLAAGLEVLATVQGASWLVLGDMGELGTDGAALHAEAGRRARAAGVRRLFAVGPLSAEAATAFGAGAQHFDDQQALIDALRAAVTADVTVLVKGSRSMGMERVVQALEVGDMAGGRG